MTSLVAQKDLIIILKKETYLNLFLLRKLHQPSSNNVSKHIFEEDLIGKPTQNLFSNFCYYLISIIDPQKHAALPWPLYDSKVEKSYRNELSNFITEYSTKGLLSPVISSYLVNPGCYKVTLLMFQLSQLAVQKTLERKMHRVEQKQLFIDMTSKYIMQSDNFLLEIEKETFTMNNKFSNCLKKRRAMEKIASIMRQRINRLNDKSSSCKAQVYLNNLVDKFLMNHTLDEVTTLEILKIKNVNSKSEFFDLWLNKTDETLESMQTEWESKMTPFIQTSESAKRCTEALITRHMGEADRNTFMIEYNHHTDKICTKQLQTHVNSEQKFILKNLVRGETLNFPNLVRSYVIAICYIMKNVRIGDEIYKFNKYLEEGASNYVEVVENMRALIGRIVNADAKLQPSQPDINEPVKVKGAVKIPPLPDLSDLRTNKDMQCRVLFNTFTPINTNRHQFNLNRICNNKFSSATKPLSKSMFLTPYHPPPREDFMKSVISCRFSSYDHPNTNGNLQDISIVQSDNRGNETIAECASGFTKNQILRLLSTKKSTNKKFKNKFEKPSISITKAKLFNESYVSTTDSNVLFRSYSSPDLYENINRKSYPKRGRKLSIMHEDSTSLLEVSGIVALNGDSGGSTPTATNISQIKSSNLPIATMRSEVENKLNEILRETESDENFIVENEIPRPQMEKVLKIQDNIRQTPELVTKTPKQSLIPVRKTSSIEKIINRFKKVRANVIPADKMKEDIFCSIAEEKGKSPNIDVMLTANKVLLPDLLSPSCSVDTNNSVEYMNQICSEIDKRESRKPRQSLGTALGVDQTFLDQFDLID